MRSTPASRVRATVTFPGRSTSSGSPINAATSGRPPAASTTAAATRGDGGFDTSRIASVPGSARSAATACLAIRPSTASVRSRPPSPITAETPPPHRSSRLIASCAPVPAAATMPTRPGRTTLAKPRQVPPSSAVPAPGPIIRRPSATARSLSSISAATSTLSLNSSTSSPAVSALCVSSAA